MYEMQDITRYTGDSPEGVGRHELVSATAWAI